MSYVSNTPDDVAAMLNTIGVASIDDLFSDIPASIQLKGLLPLPAPLAESEVDALMSEIASTNKIAHSFIGAGSYHHYVPAVVDQLSLRSEFYTAYTPYQPEVSQGTLIAIFEYQTAICRLTGMDVANASMYDGATALAEAVFMSIRTSGRTGVIIPDSVHPHYRDVLKTYAWANDIHITEHPSVNGIVDSQKLQEALSDTTSAVVVQSPNFFGIIESLSPLADIVHKAGAHLIHLTTEALALSLLKAPGECGADITCGEGLSFGNYPGFGGPALGILAAKEPFTRRMPGRLVGKSVDADGKTAYCLTLQTREQHIRRERATSNICSNEGLCALRAAIYLSLLGNNLRALGKLNHDCSSYLKRKLAEIGVNTKFSGPFFNEFVIQMGNPSSVITAMREKGFSIGVDLGRWNPAYKDCILIACTELNTPASIDAMTSTLSTIMKKVK